MGQKANPRGLRLGYNTGWDSLWYASKKSYASFAVEDLKIRSFLVKDLDQAGVAKVVIERTHKKLHIVIHVERPGNVIGKKGAGVEQLQAKLKKIVPDLECTFSVVEVRKAGLCAKIVADEIVHQIERRVFYKRPMKRAIQNTMKMGARGIRVECSGRLGGVEIARTEKYLEGQLPLHSLRSDIDFSSRTAHTSNGSCGVKVWIYRGDILADKKLERKPLGHEEKLDNKTLGHEEKSKKNSVNSVA